MKGSKLLYRDTRSCNRFIEKFFKDCLSDLKGEISFGLGIASLIFWAFAEIPQIINNFNNKSASTGVSLSFLSTWIIGDVFNLVGCILEPATLPTQFYTAVLYTSVTIILALQCIYYNLVLQWWKPKDETEPMLRGDRSGATTDDPVEIPRRRDFYFMSARSFAGSDKPPSEHNMKARSDPPTLKHQHPTNSSEEEEEGDHVLEVTQPRPIPHPMRYGVFVAASANLPRVSRALRRAPVGIEMTRILSQEQVQQLYEMNTYGQWLGWLMAAIYMGSRVPQIWLHFKRGSVEGLNPSMFVFAMVANATYVGSILVGSSEWRKIEANMPWLLDAVVCVFLDLFMILQYKYYNIIKVKKQGEHA